MPTCDTCSATVSPAFERVFADSDGRLLACPACAPGEATADAIIDRY